MDIRPFKELLHATARSLAMELADVVSPLLRPEERIDATREFYLKIRDSLERFERERKQLN